MEWVLPGRGRTVGADRGAGQWVPTEGRTTQIYSLAIRLSNHRPLAQQGRADYPELDRSVRQRGVTALS